MGVALSMTADDQIAAAWQIRQLPRQQLQGHETGDRVQNGPLQFLERAVHAINQKAHNVYCPPGKEAVSQLNVSREETRFWKVHDHLGFICFCPRLLFAKIQDYLLRVHKCIISKKCSYPFHFNYKEL